MEELKVEKRKVAVGSNDWRRKAGGGWVAKGAVLQEVVKEKRVDRALSSGYKWKKNSRRTIVALFHIFRYHD